MSVIVYSKGLQSVNYSFSAGLWLFLLYAQFYMGSNGDTCKTLCPLQNHKLTITGVFNKTVLLLEGIWNSYVMMSKNLQNMLQCMQIVDYLLEQF